MSYPGLPDAVIRYFQSSSFEKERLDRTCRLLRRMNFPVLLLQGDLDEGQPPFYYDDPTNPAVAQFPGRAAAMGRGRGPLHESREAGAGDGRHRGFLCRRFGTPEVTDRRKRTRHAERPAREPAPSEAGVTCARSPGSLLWRSARHGGRAEWTACGPVQDRGESCCLSKARPRRWFPPAMPPRTKRVLDRLQRRLTAHGVRVDDAPTGLFPERAISFRDPDGNAI